MIYHGMLDSCWAVAIVLNLPVIMDTGEWQERETIGIDTQ